MKFDGLIRLGFAALTALFQTFAQWSINVADVFIRMAGWAHRRA